MYSPGGIVRVWLAITVPFFYWHYATKTTALGWHTLDYDPVVT